MDVVHAKELTTHVVSYCFGDMFMSSIKLMVNT